jgi:hypothetical protein
MRKSGISIVAIVFLVFTGVLARGQETRIRYLSGRGKDDPVAWEFYCTAGRNSGKWTTIGVPSNWELQGFGTYNYGHDRNKASEQGRYRRTFTVPEGWKDSVIHIVFEGSMTDTEVRVNGESAGPKHQGGFYPFKYDITDKVRFGAENLLEVTVSKVSSNPSVEAAERNGDYWVFGGIYRPAYLEAVPGQFIEWTAIDARADGTISVDVHLKNITTADRVAATVLDPGAGGGGALSASVAKGAEKVTLTGRVQAAKPWTAETPHLYDLEIALRSGPSVLHKLTQRFGFRTFEVRAAQGLFLNGRRIRLKGVNRHCFWPDSGRCLSREISYADVRLIKQMNMNAVRMSHYPPDGHFLDACDELGLYVLDELAGWQRPPYDTEVGRKLVKEMLVRDVSHPCILFWDNGNEGGWNTDLDDQFALYDPQNRTVLHPWANFNNIDTDHYETYESVKGKLSGSTLFMPTEFLHGLYDGGHGAGLNDYWRLILGSKRGAGGFLWAMVDEGVVRTDKNGVIDVAGNQGPDGILGPYRQKEGSFNAVRQIWSPVHIGAEELAGDFDGRIELENRYDFTNLNSCSFELKLARLPAPLQMQEGPKVLSETVVAAPAVEPGAKGILELDLPEGWQKAGVLYLTALDPAGSEIRTWSWGIQKGCEYCHQYVAKESLKQEPEIEVVENETELYVKAGGLDLWFSRKTGQLQKVRKQGRGISLGAGPRLLAGTTGKLIALEHRRENKDLFVEARYEGGLDRATWKIYPSGWVRLDYEYELEGQFDLMGVTFDYPAERMVKMTWVGRGPYRVWKNRTEGGRLDFWTNPYKDHEPGRTWDFPEFRGYYKDWHWVRLETTEGRIIVLNGTRELFLGLYRPKDGPDPRSTKLDVPEGGISLLHGIPAIGTKFLRAEQLGPEGRKNVASGKYKAMVCFYFDVD